MLKPGQGRLTTGRGQYGSIFKPHTVRHTGTGRELHVGWSVNRRRQSVSKRTRPFTPPSLVDETEAICHCIPKNK
jgi:hypothetical protein